MPIALITGGSRGLGKSMCLHVAAAGCDVILTYKTKKDEADAVVREIESKGVRAAALSLDMADSAGFALFATSVRDVLEKMGAASFDYLVNNAGIGIYAPFAETSPAQLDLMFALHLKGPFFLTQALLPLIKDGGRILNVSSGLARFSRPGMSAYACMKGAVEVLTRYLALELGARRIAVNTVAPGAIETDFGGGLVRDNKEVNREIAAGTALGRVGLPDDIGGVVASLLNPAMEWVNGQRLEVSGGVFL